MASIHFIITISGNCEVMVGGEGGVTVTFERGDALIISAGVAHKKEVATANFQCIGSYPELTQYNMCYGKAHEYLEAVEKIKLVPLPKSDPIYGSKGPLLSFWKEEPHIS